ncbi:MAG: FtsK/SpoIIIE family protein [Paenibacillaceae bacterium]|nr:FtsK/SpoIIIE family protein [Paenibacillaceae bacterium]
MNIIQKVRKSISLFYPWVKRFIAWWQVEDSQRLRKQVISIWINGAKEDLQRAYNLVGELSSKSVFEIETPQGMVEWAVKQITWYEDVKCPYTALNFRLGLRLGLKVPALRRRVLWLLGSVGIATVTVMVLHQISWLPFDWFPISLLTGLWFVLVCTYKGHKLFPIIREVTTDHEAAEHLFNAHLAELQRQAKSLLFSKRMKKVAPIQAALQANNFQQWLVTSRFQPKSIKPALTEAVPIVEDGIPTFYYPMKQAWERFFQEVFRLKEGGCSVPLHRDFGTTEIYVWDIPAIAFSRWEDSLTRIEAYLKKQVFFIHHDYEGIGTVGVEVAKQPLPKEIHFQQMIDLRAAAQSPEGVIVGVNCKGIVLWNYHKIPHGLVAGTTGAGKSTALYSIILQLQRQNHLPVFVDLKGGVSFGFAEEVGYPVATTKEAAFELIKGTAQEVERREKLLKEWGVSPDIAIYNEMTGANLPEIFIVFDEFAQFTEKWQGLEEGMACIKSIAAKGRSNGVHLLIATQRPSQESLGSTDFRSNISFRCIGRMDSQTSSQIALGNNAAFERLPSTDYAGLFIVRGTDAPMDSLTKVPFINDMEFRRLFLEYRNPHKGYKLGFGTRNLEPIKQMKPENFNDIF